MVAKKKNCKRGLFAIFFHLLKNIKKLSILRMGCKSPEYQPITFV